jgi:hypothetical protein
MSSRSASRSRCQVKQMLSELNMPHVFTVPGEHESTDLLGCTCPNGHVHQLFSNTEGNVTCYRGATTACPLPAPGSGSRTQTGDLAPQGSWVMR